MKKLKIVVKETAFLSKIYNLTKVASRQRIAIASIISRRRSLKSLENFAFISHNTNILFLHWNNLMKLKTDFLIFCIKKLNISFVRRSRLGDKNRVLCWKPKKVIEKIAYFHEAVVAMKESGKRFCKCAILFAHWRHHWWFSNIDVAPESSRSFL